MILEEILSAYQTFFFSPVREAFVGLVPPPTPHAPGEAPYSLSTSQAWVNFSVPPYRFGRVGNWSLFPLNNGALMGLQRGLTPLLQLETGHSHLSQGEFHQPSRIFRERFVVGIILMCNLLPPKFKATKQAWTRNDCRAALSDLDQRSTAATVNLQLVHKPELCNRLPLNSSHLFDTIFG